MCHHSACRLRAGQTLIFRSKCHKGRESIWTFFGADCVRATISHFIEAETERGKQATKAGVAKRDAAAL